MEKATIVPQLFEVECPPEKKQIETGKYKTLKLKCLVNKETGVTSCKYASCDWAKCSMFSKTVVLKLPLKRRGNAEYYPYVLWNYETGETFSMYEYTEFVKISIEEHDTHYRSFFTIYDTIITCNTVTGEKMTKITCQKENEYAVPFVAETGNLVWQIKSRDHEKQEANATTYEDVKLTSINGVDLWMVKHHKTDDWWLLYKHNKIASSVTGNFVKKGLRIFGQIENDRYRLYRLLNELDFKEVTLELKDESAVLDHDHEISFKKMLFHPEDVIGLTSDGKHVKIKGNRAYPLLSPENKDNIHEKILMYAGDEDFVPRRSYLDWAHYNYPWGTVAGFNVKMVRINSATRHYFTLLQDLDNDAEIVVKSKKSMFEEGATTYLKVIRDLQVDIITEKVSRLFSHKAVINPRYFEVVTEEEYTKARQSKQPQEENVASVVPQDKPEQGTKEPEPSLLEKKIPELESFVKYLFHEVEGEVSIKVHRDADGNVSISIL